MGGCNAAMQLSHFSGGASGALQQSWLHRGGPSGSYLTEREARGHLSASRWGSLLENEGVNILSFEAGMKRGQGDESE